MISMYPLHDAYIVACATFNNIFSQMKQRQVNKINTVIFLEWYPVATHTMSQDQKASLKTEVRLVLNSGSISEFRLESKHQILFYFISVIK